MLILLSPAKRLDSNRVNKVNAYTLPDHLRQSEILVNALKKKSPRKLSELMNINASLAQLNFERYQQWHLPFTVENSLPAAFAFRGDVYQGLKIEEFSEEDLQYAQQHLRILSGLYGLLRPLDLIQLYRLEMGTKLKTGRKKNLYEFWGKTITQSVKQALTEQDDNLMINLASDEYFKSINTDTINTRVITPVFKEFKNGTYKFMSFYGKKARGLMASYLLRNKVTTVEGIKLFGEQGYLFNESLSNADKLVFTRS